MAYRRGLGDAALTTTPYYIEPPPAALTESLRYALGPVPSSSPLFESLPYTLRPFPFITVAAPVPPGEDTLTGWLTRNRQTVYLAAGVLAGAVLLRGRR